MKQNIKQGLNKSIYIWLAFLVAFLPRLIFLADVHTLSIGGDEIFSMWPAAKAVGYEWEGVMTNYRYYGYGYSLLMLPFFKFIKDSVILYRSLVFVMILAQSLVAPISYHLMEKYLDVKSKTVLCLSGIACSYLVTIRAVYTYPEFIYTFVFWLIVWVMLKLIHSEGKQKIGLTVVLIGLMAYELTVHSRGITIWMALLGTIIYCFWVYRKSIVSIPVFAVVGAVGYIVGQRGIDLVLNYLGNRQTTGTQNASVTIPTSILDFLPFPQAWNACVNIVVGQLNEAVINTGGIAVAIVIVFLVLVWKALCRNREIVDTEKSFYQPYVVVGVFCMAAVVITIGGQMVTWLPGVMNAINGGDPDSYRAFTYFRYYGAYVGPLLMLGIAYFNAKPELLDWVKNKTLVVTCLLQGYWVFVILAFICYFNGCVWSYAPFSFTKGFYDEIGVTSYLPGSIVVGIVLVISYFLVVRKKPRYILWILCVFLIYSYAYNAVNHEGIRGNRNYEYIVGGRNLIDALMEENALPEKVYVERFHVPNSGQMTPCIYQFVYLDIPIVEWEPTNGKDNIYICYNPEAYEHLLEEGYKLFELSEYEYAYIRGEKIIEILQ